MNKLFFDKRGNFEGGPRSFNMYHIFRYEVSFYNYKSLNYLSNIELDHFGRIMKYFIKSFLYYNQGS